MESRVSGVGVLDKSMSVVAAVADGASSVAEVVAATGIPKPSAHRLAGALVAHGLLRRDGPGGLVLGPQWVVLGRVAAATWPVLDVTGPVLERLRDETGESVQLFVRRGAERLCVASLESAHELRTIVAVGARLPLERGSAGHLLGAPSREVLPRWRDSVEERAPGVASVSALAVVHGEPVAVSVSGPIDRLGRRPGRRYGQTVAEAAADIEARAVGGT